ncbi:MAG: hypothetical protein JJT75_07130 [Opitutales bacterium]|nr:hypothetical protein [Opitutales bacterium]MCH8540525.1 hypothetical protein [Opitutales bacterium]
MKNIVGFAGLIFLFLSGPLSGGEKGKLFLAVDAGDVEKVVKLIVEHDFNLNEFYSDDHVHLLSVALSNDDIKMFEKLLLGGADPNQKSSKRSQFSVGARIIDLPMKEEFLTKALRHGLDPNLGTPPLGSDESEPLIIRTIRHNYQMPYFIILLNHGAYLESDEEWLRIFERSLTLNNYRLAWYIFSTQDIEPKLFEEKSWWIEFNEQSSDEFYKNHAYWRDALIREVKSKNLEDN